MEEKSARHSFVHNMLRLDIQSRFFMIMMAWTWIYSFNQGIQK